jgi:hypothetical protein
MKDEELNSLLAWLKSASTYELPDYQALPHVPLYMEQVTDYINEVLKPLNSTEKDALTSFMVNNYVKASIMEAPKNKRYNVDQLGYLIAITSLKRSLTISEIALLIEMDSDVSKDKSVLYGFFRVMSKDILQEVTTRALGKSEEYAARYHKEKAEGNPKADANLRDSLGLISLRMAIQSAVYGIVSQSILDAIGRDMKGDQVYLEENTPGHKEKEREAKINRDQILRVGMAKKRASKPVKKGKEDKK